MTRRFVFALEARRTLQTIGPTDITVPAISTVLGLVYSGRGVLAGWGHLAERHTIGRVVSWPACDLISILSGGTGHTFRTIDTLRAMLVRNLPKCTGRRSTIFAREADGTAHAERLTRVCCLSLGAFTRHFVRFFATTAGRALRARGFSCIGVVARDALDWRSIFVRTVKASGAWLAVQVAVFAILAGAAVSADRFLVGAALAARAIDAGSHASC